jgi:hypothetical protein
MPTTSRRSWRAAIDGLAADGTSPCPAALVRRWRLADRLGEQSIRELIADRRAGATKGELVERYGISMSSVKRLLKPDRMSCRAIR